MKIKKYLLLDLCLITLLMIITEVIITKTVVNGMFAQVGTEKLRNVSTYSLSLALLLVGYTRWKKAYLALFIPLTLLMFIVTSFKFENLIIIGLGNLSLFSFLMIYPKKNNYKIKDLIKLGILSSIFIIIGRILGSVILGQDLMISIIYYIAVDILGMILTPLILGFASGIDLVGNVVKKIQVDQERKAKNGQQFKANL
ncbi:hypothetical protein BN85406350 [Alteracholeplasma palmae J233]|uniref:Uncharacterized protein n=1 Tax=Alteracholeplasma palmae (strain ATCC 49389 / J233) TaxID=1318466 RepID=U4KKN5_ALTPJ|nr:hypothetical protein [Alteracholeplasma palmae]CCV64212.1 hypothetical protein BN85406350 [Alteracholeplasma palmae J233]